MDIVARPIGEQAQQCRTCSHGNDPYWNVSLGEVMNAGRDRAALAELACHPTKVEITRKIRGDGVLVKLSDPSRPVDKRDVDPTSTEIEPVYVNSCGHHLLPKCRNCAHLQTQTINVPHNLYPHSTREVIIVGSCGIPAEGMMVDGKVVTCAPKKLPRLRKIIPSCDNCKFQFVTDENWQLDDFSVNDVDLTPYEMEKVRRAAGGSGPQVGIAIARARIAKNSTVTGRYRWYGVDIVGEEDDDFEIMLPTGLTAVLHTEGMEVHSYTLVRTKGAVTRKVDPEVIKLYRLPHQRLAMEIKMPHQAAFGFVDGPGGNDGTMKRTRVLPALPEREGARYWTHPETHRKFRIWPRDEVDYFESKDPRFSTVRNEVDFNPKPTPPRSDTGSWNLRLVFHNGHYRVVDDRFLFHQLMVWAGCAPLAQADLDPHPRVFQLRVRNFAQIAKAKGGMKGWTDVMRQWWSVKERYPLSRPYEATPNLLHPIGLEPFKNYCSVNLAEPAEGIDFRATFGDSFGMDRTEYSRTQTYEMQRDEWFRATHAGNELHGEIMRTEMLDPAWPLRSVTSKPLRFEGDKVILDTFGNEIDDPEEWTMDDAVADTRAYVDFLDERIQRPGLGGQLVWEDRRMQLHGYTMYRGSRTEASPNFVMNEDGDDVRDKLYCPTCDKSYPLTSMNNNRWLPVLDCPECHEELFVGRAGGEPATWVKMGKRIGIGTAIAADSESFQSRQRMRQSLCSSWRFRPNPSITYADVLPQKESVEPFRPELDKAVQDQQDFEFLGIATNFVGGSTTGGWRPYTVTPRPTPPQIDADACISFVLGMEGVIRALTGTPRPVERPDELEQTVRRAIWQNFGRRVD